MTTQELPPYEETTGALRKLLEVEMGLDLIGAQRLEEPGDRELRRAVRLALHRRPRLPGCVRVAHGSSSSTQSETLAL